MFARVCPPTKPLITSYVKGTRNNWIMMFYSYFVSLYDTAIDKLNRHGLSNTAGRERHCFGLCVGMFAHVCVSAPRPLITSYVKGTRNNQIMMFYSYFVSLYNTAIDKLNRHGLSNTASRERLPKKSQVMRY